MVSASFKHSPEMEGLSGLLRFAKDPTGVFEQAREKHGTLVRYEQPGGDVRLVFEPAVIDALLLGASDHVKKDLFTRELKPVIGLGLVTNEGASWKVQRKRLAPSFQPKHLRAYADAMREATLDLVAALEADAVRNVHPDMMKLTLDIVVRTLFGTKIAKTDEVERLLDQAVADYRRLMMSWRMAFPLWFPFVSRLRFNRVKTQLRDVIDELIVERRKAPLGDDMISRLLEARDDEGNAMSDTQLLDEALTMLLAGHETTALALTFTLGLLTRHPEVQEKLRAEVRTVLEGREVTFEDVPRLVYAKAVLREALRIYPPVWATGREATADFELDGESIKKGTQLVVSPWVTHRDARFFPNPEEFRPERWLSEETEKLPKGAYFPFGLGPRVCIGNHFAELEALVVLATLIAKFEFGKTSDAPQRVAPSVTLRPEGEVLLRVVRIPETAVSPSP